MQYDTTLTRNELERTVAQIAPGWHLQDAVETPSEAGHHVVYRLTVDTARETRDWFLKATPDGRDSSVDLEGRLLAVLDAETTLPVPSVRGLVDTHEELPAPFALFEALPGTATPRAETSSLPAATHRRVARDVGRRLADLHDLDAVDAFGFLHSSGPVLDGATPSGDPATLTVHDPVTDWRDRLRGWVAEAVDDLRDGQFADLGPAAERALADRIDSLDGPFEPVLARIDQSLENALIDEGRLCGMIDWEFTIAATPAYDVVHVVASLSGGPFVFAPSVTDRRDLVHDAVLAGYRERGPDRIVEQVRANRDCYELLFALRAMGNLTEWFPMLDLGGQVDDAALALREEVTSQL